ncbi:hypothetical protein JB92DRAFT_2839089 [Gautieria morchelliformis]|nr:hypothetical protein JB92DRAFT_2839089 [Gautieria morchelliformis]
MKFTIHIYYFGYTNEALACRPELTRFGGPPSVAREVGSVKVGPLHAPGRNTLWVVRGASEFEASGWGFKVTRKRLLGATPTRGTGSKDQFIYWIYRSVLLLGKILTIIVMDINLTNIQRQSGVLPTSKVVYLTPYECGGVIRWLSLDRQLCSPVLTPAGSWSSDSLKWAASPTALVIGDLGHCVITGHIFSVLALERQWSRKVVVSIVVTGWTFVTSQSEYAPIIVLNQAVLKRLLLPGPNESAQWIFLLKTQLPLPAHGVAKLGIHYIPSYFGLAKYYNSKVWLLQFILQITENP